MHERNRPYGPVLGTLRVLEPLALSSEVRDLPLKSGVLPKQTGVAFAGIDWRGDGTQLLD
jgi:hypothetical protein